MSSGFFFFVLSFSSQPSAQPFNANKSKRVRQGSRINAPIPVCLCGCERPLWRCNESPIKCVCATESDTFATADKPGGSLKTYVRPSKVGQNEGLLVVFKPTWKLSNLEVEVSPVFRSLSVVLTHWPLASQLPYQFFMTHGTRQARAQCFSPAPPFFFFSQTKKMHIPQVCNLQWA